MQAVENLHNVKKIKPSICERNLSFIFFSGPSCTLGPTAQYEQSIQGPPGKTQLLPVCSLELGEKHSSEHNSVDTISSQSIPRQLARLNMLYLCKTVLHKLFPDGRCFCKTTSSHSVPIFPESPVNRFQCESNRGT